MKGTSLALTGLVLISGGIVLSGSGNLFFGGVTLGFGSACFLIALVFAFKAKRMYELRRNI